MKGHLPSLLKMVISLLSSIVCGFVLSVMWGWFIVSTFHIASLNIPSAIGLSLCISMLTARYTDDADRIKYYWAKSTAFDIALSAITLICGYIVHLFV